MNDRPNELIEKFEKNGFVKIPKNYQLEQLLNDLAPTIQSLCPDYESNTMPHGHYSLLDTALQHRLDDEGLLPKETIHGNCLFGKRISFQTHDLPAQVVELFEHSHIIDSVAKVLGTSDVVLLNAAVAGSYPGNTGNDKQYHSDTANFTDAKRALKCVRDNNFVVNVQIFLDDIDEALAPMKILPGTHAADVHSAINSKVSERLGLSDSRENLIGSMRNYSRNFICHQSCLLVVVAKYQ